MAAVNGDGGRVGAVGVSLSKMAPVDVMTLCWARIQPYVDVISLVSVSKSCWPLRNVVVDAATGRIKASAVRINSTIDDDGEGNVDAESPSARIAQYAPRVINAIHFPSLTKLMIGFPPNVSSWNGRRVVDKNSFPEAFPMFAIEVENAANLEELEIDVGSLIAHEEGGALRSSFEILRDNLAFLLRRTRKLRRLTIFNEVTFDHDRGEYSKFSSAFLAAMVPVIRACLLSLEEVTIRCGDEPSCLDYPDAGVDFFEAVLGLQKLRTLTVQIQASFGPLLKDFVDAARSILTTLGHFPSESLECVNLPVRFLQVNEGQQLPFPRPSIAPFLSLCKAAPSLRELRAWLPQECWGTHSIAALGHILNGMPSMEHVSLYFNGYKDGSGKVLSYLSHFREERESSPGPRVHLLQLAYLPEQSEQFQRLGRYADTIEDEGELFWQFHS